MKTINTKKSLLLAGILCTLSAFASILMPTSHIYAGDSIPNPSCPPQPADYCSINNPIDTPLCFQFVYIPTLVVKNSRVGILTNSPDANFALDIAGDMRAQSKQVRSDQRLKDNITLIDNALDSISRINGYQFTWKNSGQPDFGVLAQELQNIFPLAVSTDSKDMLSVNYDSLFAPIIQAIHEINTIIEEQKDIALDHQKRIDKLISIK